MQKRTIVNLHPDLVIGIETAIDRMGATASRSAERAKPNFAKQVQLVRSVARQLCTMYRNCRGEDWCWHCSSGQNGQLYIPSACLGCKLLTADAYLEHAPKLVQIQLPAEDPADII